MSSDPFIHLPGSVEFDPAVGFSSAWIGFRDGASYFSSRFNLDDRRLYLSLFSPQSLGLSQSVSQTKFDVNLEDVFVSTILSNCMIDRDSGNIISGDDQAVAIDSYAKRLAKAICERGSPRFQCNK